MGIPSKAAWLLGREASQGAVTFAGVTVTGIGDVDASRVWYDVLTNRLNSTSVFTQFAIHVRDSATALFGASDNRTTQATAAVDAVGIWRPALGQGFDSDYGVSLVEFTVAGEWRTYVFYKEPVWPDPRLLYRYRTCTLVGACSWSSAATFLDYTGRGPASAVFDGRLYVFYKYDLNDTIRFRSMDSTGAWTVPTLPGTPTTDSSLSAAVFNNTLYLFYKTVGTGAQKLFYYSCTTACDSSSNWSGPFTVSGTDGAATSDHGPAAVAPLNGLLWLVYVQGTAASNLRYRTLSSSGSWGQQLSPGWQQSLVIDGSPTARIFRDRLHIGGRTTGGSFAYKSFCLFGLSCTYRPADWTYSTTPSGAYLSPPALYSDSTWLYSLMRQPNPPPFGGSTVVARYKRSE